VRVPTRVEAEDGSDPWDTSAKHLQRRRTAPNSSCPSVPARLPYTRLSRLLHVRSSVTVPSRAAAGRRPAYICPRSPVNHTGRTLPLLAGALSPSGERHDDRESVCVLDAAQHALWS
jgi:hypothetical protein